MFKATLIGLGALLIGSTATMAQTVKPAGWLEAGIYAPRRERFECRENPWQPSRSYILGGDLVYLNPYAKGNGLQLIQLRDTGYRCWTDAAIEMEPWSYDSCVGWVEGTRIPKSITRECKIREAEERGEL